MLGAWIRLSEGLVLVPLLLAVEIPVSKLVATHIALGTSLIVIAVISWLRVYRAARDSQIVIRAAVPAVSAGVITAVGGGLLAGTLEGKTLQQTFGVAAAFAAVRLLGEMRKPKGELKMESDVPGLVSTGLIAGAFSPMTGISASLVAVPILYTLRRVPLMKAIGSSETIAAVVATVSAAVYVLVGRTNPFLPDGSLGYVDGVYGLCLLAGLIPGGLLGMRLTSRTPSPAGRKFLALLILIVAAWMFFR